MAGLLLLWAWISYRVMFSAEVIRFGLLFLYIIPCFAGGKIIAGSHCARPLLGGALLGIAVYALCAAGSISVSIWLNGKLPQPELSTALPLLICVPSGLLGAFRPKKAG
jgi:hypothetical protein